PHPHRLGARHPAGEPGLRSGGRGDRRDVRGWGVGGVRLTAQSSSESSPSLFSSSSKSVVCGGFLAAHASARSRSACTLGSRSQRSPRIFFSNSSRSVSL